MSRVISVAGIQMGPCSLDKSKNLKKGLELLDEAYSKYRPDIVCFNELFQTYFFAVEVFEDSAQFFETIPGPTTQKLGERAKKYNMTIVAGLAEVNEAGEHYNSSVAIGPDGNVLGRYRKCHMPIYISPPNKKTFEKYYFRQGNLGFPVISTQKSKIGMLICYDRHFPEAFRVLSLRGAEIVFVPTGARTWGKEWRSEMWEALLRTRAYENSVFVVAVNKAGKEGDTKYLGKSMIISPIGGEVIAVSGKNDYDIICAKLDLDLTGKAQEAVQFNRDRRPEFYSTLTNSENI